MQDRVRERVKGMEKARGERNKMRKESREGGSEGRRKGTVPIQPFLLQL